ncbi:DUF2303 family protein [Solwaraspora sp. WMMD1047]|uniref:DUF2303 family protein n=1 Tax=Solwaraspora sp. WMMD1047 TaxID=3016102 RepID=UPI0024168C1C|nr:DUF2303 family protein [Solwaraspora sp. WMMD1047]MDG4832401.1 DUF2303 family protein [Solwaraspora sp. WMMD1047]
MTSDIENEMQTIVGTALVAAEPTKLDLGGYYIVKTPAGVQHVDLTGDAYRDNPRRKIGTVTVRDAPSFLAVFAKHASPTAEIYADRDRGTITAVLDAHPGDGGTPAWQQHRAVLQLRHSKAFTAWREISGQLMAQTAFAEFVEDHRADIRTPAAADVLEMAQTIQGTTKVAWKSSMLLTNGQRQLSYVEQVDANAGRRGEMAIPDSLGLALAVFDGAAVADPVTARLRFRINGEGRLTIGVILDQLDDVINAAFEGVVEQVAGGVPVPILRGTAPA